MNSPRRHVIFRPSLPLFTPLLLIFVLLSLVPSSVFATEPEQYTFDSNEPQYAAMAAKSYSLPPLPYAYNALEPHISAQIMELHHSKHHNTYITNLNAALGSLATASSQGDVPTQIALQSAIKFNGGGHINHSLFWQNLAPASSAEAKSSSAPQLIDAIKKTWGDEQAFKDAFKAALLGIQGSGWGWLVKVEGQSKEPRLVIQTTKDQDPIVGKGEVPIFGVDMWEHAYYLQYLNGKPAYIDNIWNIINWKTSEARYLGKQADAFSVLKASI